VWKTLNSGSAADRWQVYVHSGDRSDDGGPSTIDDDTAACVASRRAIVAVDDATRVTQGTTAQVIVRVAAGETVGARVIVVDREHRVPVHDANTHTGYGLHAAGFATGRSKALADRAVCSDVNATNESFARLRL
jgi:hypothetical protein